MVYIINSMLAILYTLLIIHHDRILELKTTFLSHISNSLKIILGVSKIHSEIQCPVFWAVSAFYSKAVEGTE